MDCRGIPNSSASHRLHVTAFWVLVLIYSERAGMPMGIILGNGLMGVISTDRGHTTTSFSSGYIQRLQNQIVIFGSITSSSGASGKSYEHSSITNTNLYTLSGVHSITHPYKQTHTIVTFYFLISLVGEGVMDTQRNGFCFFSFFEMTISFLSQRDYIWCRVWRGNKCSYRTFSLGNFQVPI